MSKNNALKNDKNLRKLHSESLKGRKRPDQSEFMKRSNPMKRKEVSIKVSKKLKGRHTKNEFKEGHVSWCKGLTKENDVRVRKQAESLKKTLFKKKELNNDN
jgi:hypothetical protein